MKLAHLFEDKASGEILVRQLKRLISLADPYTGSGGDPLYLEFWATHAMHRGRAFKCHVFAVDSDDPIVSIDYARIHAKPLDIDFDLYRDTNHLIDHECTVTNINIEDLPRLELEYSDNKWVLKGRL